MSFVDTLMVAIIGPEHKKGLSKEEDSVLRDNIEKVGVEKVSQAYSNTKDIKAIPQELETISNVEAYQKMMENAQKVDLDGSMLNLAARFAKDLAGSDHARADVAQIGVLSPSQGSSAERNFEKHQNRIVGSPDEGIT